MRHYWLTSDAPDLPGNAFKKGIGRNRPATLEGGKGGSTPEAPDPWNTARAQTESNNQSAAFNKSLNLNNYTNPFGSQQSTYQGLDPVTGAPIYNTTLSANPQLQNQLNSLITQTSNSAGINNTALNGLYGLNSQYSNVGNNIGGYASNALGLNSGYSALNSQLAGLGSQLSPTAAQQAQQHGQDAAYKAQTQYLDPQFSQQSESLSAQLANQGITPGSEAYNNAMTNFNNQKQQAYSNAQNQAILTGSQLGTQNLQNQISGINTQAGLLGQQSQNLGSQAGLYGLAGSLSNQQLSALNGQAGLYGQTVGIGQSPYSNLSSIASLIPGYSGTGQASTAPADIGSYINNNYQSQLASHNADVQSANSTTGAIAGLAGAAALAFF